MEALVILHLGLGSFHRAHQAMYLNHLIDKGDTRWQIAGGNLRPDMADTVDALIRQNGEYVLETVTPDGKRDYERIRSIRKVLPWEASLANLIAVGSEPGTRIISFTVTEAGYYLNGHNELETSYGDLASDLAGTTRTTIYGALAAILAERRAKDAGPVTLMCCDNLRSNGERFRHGFLAFLAERGDKDLLAWVEANTTSPNSMVDRITPRPTPDVAQRVKAATGFDDGAAVMGESFVQWVIEDDFCNERPDWEAVGAELVDSVEPYEEAKIRILNASHSCIAWAGTLRGFSYIHEGTHDTEIRGLAHAYVTDDVIPCLTPSPLDLAAYRDTVLERFSNSNIRDTNQRVAADGFAKIPGFIAPTIRERLAAGASVAAVAMLPALFFAFLKRWHAGELPYAYQDQSMDQQAAHALFWSDDPLAAFCNDRILWESLAGDPRLLAALSTAHDRVTAFANGKRK
jgi:D-arabinitol 4-dehydrogenase